jgi:hypothetical protein
VKGKTVKRDTGALEPGQRYELYYEVKKNTESVTVRLHDVVPGAVQNELFGDDIFMSVHSAKTHLDSLDECLLYAPSAGGTWVFTDPEPGLMRVTLTGDWTNASPIHASVTIESGKEKLPKNTATGKLVEGQQLSVSVVVPPGVGTLSALLRWTGDWSRYPTNDLDLYATDADGTAFEAATVDAPERFEVAGPGAGTWSFLVDGFTIYDSLENWELVVLADGVRLKRVP